MDKDDKILQDYVKRLMDQQYGMGSKKPMTDEELKEIALEMGMTDREYAESLARAESHYQRGKAYIKSNNYEDAIIELTHTVNIYPNHVDGLYLLAKAYTHRGLLDNNSDDLSKADLYVNRALTLEPMHAGALDLKSQKRKGERTRSTNNATKAKTGKLVKYGLIGLVALIIVVTWINISNSMNALETQVETSWANVEENYQRRADLIPQLVKVVKAAADYEQETLDKVIQARNTATGININLANASQEDMNRYLAAQQELGAGLNKLFALAESYPDLKASQNFLNLQDEIAGTENRISYTRKEYNRAVGAYNEKAGRFPTSLFGYDDLPYFKVSPGVEQVPEMNL